MLLPLIACTPTGLVLSMCGAGMPVQVVAIDPNNKDHFLYSNATGWQTWESTDGGQTVHNLHHPTGSFYVAIDRQVPRHCIALSVSLYLRGCVAVSVCLCVCVSMVCVRLYFCAYICLSICISISV